MKRWWKWISLPFKIGVLEVLLVGVRVQAGGATTATLSGFDGVDDDQGEEEDGEDAPHDHGYQRLLRDVLCEQEQER